MVVLDTGVEASVIQEKIATKLKLKRFTIDNALLGFVEGEEEEVQRSAKPLIIFKKKIWKHQNKKNLVSLKKIIFAKILIF